MFVDNCSSSISTIVIILSQFKCCCVYVVILSVDELLLYTYYSVKRYRFKKISINNMYSKMNQILSETIEGFRLKFSNKFS